MNSYQLKQTARSRRNNLQNVQRPLLNFKASKDKAKDRRKSSSNDQNQEDIYRGDDAGENEVISDNKSYLYRASRRQMIVLEAGNPPVARTGSDNPRSARQGSDNPGADIPRATRQGSDNPPVARTGSDNPGSDNPRGASPRTNGSSVSVLPQAPEEAVHRSAGWDRSYQARGPT